VYGKFTAGTASTFLFQFSDSFTTSNQYRQSSFLIETPGEVNLRSGSNTVNVFAATLVPVTTTSSTGLAVTGATVAGFSTPITATNPSTNAASAAKIAFNSGGTVWGEIGASYNSNDPYMAFFVRSGSEKMRITDGGNVGLACTPRPWVGINAFEVNTGSTTGTAFYAGTGNGAYIGNNLYWDSGAGWTTAYSSRASTLLSIINGEFTFSRAAAGTAGTAASLQEKVRIDSSGNLLVGKTASGLGSNGFNAQPDGYISCSLAGSTSATDTLNVYSTGAAAYRFYVDMGGTIHATSIVITAISDERLKENVRDIDTGLDAIMALKPRRFDWKDGKGQNKKNAAGFIAQEFENVFPESVGTSKAGEDGVEYKDINHETLIPSIVKALQELNANLVAELQSLRQRVAALENSN
jgi:hypothetical protein